MSDRATIEVLLDARWNKIISVSYQHIKLPPLIRHSFRLSSPTALTLPAKVPTEMTGNDTIIETSPSGQTVLPSSRDTSQVQIGGGRRAPSPPPEPTPTRLRTNIKATAKDCGLVREAQARRGLLLQNQSGEDDLFHVALPGNGPSQVQPARLLFGDSNSLSPPSLDGPRSGKTDVGPPSAVAMHASAAVQPTPTAEKPLSFLAKPTSASTGPPSAAGAKEGRAKFEPVSTKSVGPADHPRTPPPRPPGEVRAICDEDDSTPRPTSPGELPLFANDAEIYPNSPTPTRRQFSAKSPPLLTEADQQWEMVDGPAENKEGLPCGNGRTPASTVAILEDGFDMFHQLFAELAVQAGMSVSQVVSRFAKLYSRSNLGNYWNLYQPYHMAHKAQELGRLGEVDVVTATPTDKMAKCYKLFREKYPDTYQEILTTWHEAEALGDADRTVAQRAQLFSKLAKKFEQQCSAMAKSHSFEVAFVMGGSVVNQDISLGRAFTTEGAEGFFAERCRADTDEIIGHFKAHIFNKLSLLTVSDAFDADDGPEVPIKKNGGDERSRAGGEQDEREDHARVKSQLVGALARVGCKWASGKLFPWKNFPSKLAKSGAVCYGWPDNVLLPGEDRQPRPKGGSKGISDLTLAECSSLLVALNDTSKEGLCFKPVGAEMKGLASSHKPVIHCAAPSSDSRYAYARRMFVNLTIDRKGLPRKEKAAPIRIRKRGKGKQPSGDAPSTTHVDSDDAVVEVHPPAPRSLRPRLSPVCLSEAVEEVGVVTRSQQSEPMVVIATKHARKTSLGFVIDISSSSGSEYVPDGNPAIHISDEETQGYKQASSSRKRKFESKACSPPSRGARKRVKFNSSLATSTGKAKSTEQRGGGLLRPKRPCMLVRSVISSEDELEDVPGDELMQQDSTLLPTPQIDHGNYLPSAENIQMHSESSNIDVIDNPSEGVPPSLKPSLEPKVTPHCINAMLSDEGIPVIPSDKATALASVPGGLEGQQPLVPDIPKQPARPKPQFYVRKTTEDEQYLQPQAQTVLKIAQTENHVSDRPCVFNLPLDVNEESNGPARYDPPQCLVPEPLSTTDPDVARVPERPPSTQRSCHDPSPYVPPPLLVNYDREAFVPRFPSVQGFPDHMARMGAGAHETYRYQQGTLNDPAQIAYVRGGGWYQPMGLDPRLHPFMGTPFAHYRPHCSNTDNARTEHRRDTAQPHAQLQPHDYSRAPQAGYEPHPYYYYNTMQQQYPNLPTSGDACAPPQHQDIYAPLQPSQTNALARSNQGSNPDQMLDRGHGGPVGE